MQPLSRRDFLKTTSGALAAGAVALPWLTGQTASAQPAATQPTSRPNVLMIVIDDLNDWVGCLGGHPNTITPNIDRLALRGLLFTGAYCAAPLSAPSRAAFFTGVRPSTSGAYTNRTSWLDKVPHALTMPRNFKDAGYITAGYGKLFHKGQNDPTAWHDSALPGRHAMPKNRPANGIPEIGSDYDWAPLDVPEDEMDDHRQASRAIAFLDRSHDRPFFLACGLVRPHLPWYVPKKYFDMHPLEEIQLPEIKEDDLNDVPAAGVAMANPNRIHKPIVARNQWRQGVQAYLASITFADAQVGRVLDALDKSPYRDNTIVVLWSDHGWHLGEKLHWAKSALWEEATRNVLIMAGPGVPAGAKCDRIVNLMDVYPTLIEQMGLSRPAHIEGQSLLPLIKNPQAAWDRPTLTTFRRGNHSVRSQHWRYIQYADGSEELYDHRVDPQEWKNLAKDPAFAAVIAEHRRWLPQKNAE